MRAAAPRLAKVLLNRHERTSTATPPFFRPLAAHMRSFTERSYVPMNPNPLHDPKHSRKRADATRAKADVLADQAARQKLMRVVHEYERLAERAEQWLIAQKDRPSERWLRSDGARDPG